jgi:uncharacterized protein (TIGR01244 family)
MRERVPVSKDVTAGTQPAPEQLPELYLEGFRSVVNLRAAGEKGETMSPEIEAEAAREAGLAYLHLPVPMGDMRFEQADEFRGRLQHLPKPAYVHCGGARRAGAFAMIAWAMQENATGEQALAKADEIGLPLDTPELRQFVLGYVDAHRPD